MAAISKLRSAFFTGYKNKMVARIARTIVFHIALLFIFAFL